MKASTLLMAFRNLGRHKVKTTLTMIAIVIGIALYIFLDAMYLGLDIDSQRNLVSFETGAAKVYSEAYFNIKDEMPLYEGFTGYELVIESLDEAGYNAAPRAVFPASLMSRQQELPFKMIGIDPELDKSVFRIHEFLEEGSSWLENGIFTTVLGVRGASKLGVQPGDMLRMSTIIDMKDENGIIRHVHQSIELKVAGIINTPNPYTNGYVAFVPLDILQDEQGVLLEGRVTELCINIKGASISDLPGKETDPETINEALGGSLPPGLVIVGWEEDAKDFLAMSRSKRGGGTIIIIMLLFISAIVISNTMLMAVFERTKEIGMLRALGMKDSNIIRLFMTEAGMIGFFGSLIGITIGIVINIFMTRYGIDMGDVASGGNMDEVGYRVSMDYLRSAWNWNTIIVSGFLATFIATVTALLPAFRAVRMKIVDTLRFE
jgi:ABC-type lipoprotein release transport system permease subunit